MKILKLTNGGHTKLDDRDFEWANQWKWQQNKDGYAIRSGYARYQSGRYIYLHRELLTISETKKHGDHINHNRLDNRRKNLRVCTYQQNNANKSKQKNNTSGFTGVTKSRNTWKAFTYFNNQRIHIIQTTDKEEAAYIRDQFVLQLFGNFANTNFDYD